MDGAKIYDLTCRSLDLVNCTLTEKISHLSLSCDNTSGKKNGLLAHRKAKKQDRLSATNDLLPKNGIVADGPAEKLELVLKNSSQILLKYHVKYVQVGDLSISKARKLSLDASNVSPLCEDVQAIQVFSLGTDLAPVNPLQFGEVSVREKNLWPGGVGV